MVISEEIKAYIKREAERLIRNNNENYEMGIGNDYTDGVHDGILDLISVLGIETDEEYIN